MQKVTEQAVVAQNRGYWGYQEMDAEQLKHVTGAGDGGGCGAGCGGCGGDSGTEATECGGFTTEYSGVTEPILLT